MKNRDKHVARFKEALKEENLKFTYQRLQVLNVLLENSGHYECEDIMKMLDNMGLKVSRATVYRTLDILVKYNFARKLVLDDGIAKYENKIDSNHHDHMICIESGKILEFHCEEIERLQEEIALEKGYKIVKHVHQLFVKKIDK
tara:strand:+ start:90 stop:521 length:432 start_codon:yes stop_codon:yes gene_type:complete